MTTSHKGPHMYQRIKITRLVDAGNGRHRRATIGYQYKCLITNCSHYMPRPELVEGMLSICNGGCGNAVIMTKSQLTLKKPMCQECREKRKEIRRKLQEIA
jgi:hypothetical protein